MAQESVSDTDALAFLPLLRKDRPEPETLTTALAHAHTRGMAIDWQAYYSGTAPTASTCRPTPSSAAATGWTMP